MCGITSAIIAGFLLPFLREQSEPDPLAVAHADPEGAGLLEDVTDPLDLEAHQVAGLPRPVDGKHVIQLLGNARDVLKKVGQKVPRGEVHRGGPEWLRGVLLDVLGQIHGYALSAKSSLHPRVARFIRILVAPLPIEHHVPHIANFGESQKRRAYFGRPANCGSLLASWSGTRSGRTE